VPAGGVIESGAFRYQSQWRLEGERLRVVRELVIAATAVTACRRMSGISCQFAKRCGGI
jgi:hypothetical protein